MAHDNRFPPGPYRSSAYDDRMYDDRYSRSRSVERGHYGGTRSSLHEEKKQIFAIFELLANELMGFITQKTMLGTLLEDQPVTIEDTTSLKIETTEAGHLRHHTAAAVKRAIEIATARAIVPQITTVAVAAAAMVEVMVETATVIAIVLARKAEKQEAEMCKSLGVPPVAPRLMSGQISNELLDYYHVRGLEDVRVIRDRQTKLSRQIGFLRFHTLNDSRDFMDQNAPILYLYGRKHGNDDRAAKVRIAYTRERDDRRARPEGEWTCRNCSFDNFSTRQKCFRCQADRAEAEMAPEEMPARVVNIGDNDVAPDNTPSQFLLFRGLDGSATEEVFSKGVTKLYKPSADDSQHAENGPKKSKVVSTTGNSNLGAREGSLRRVLLVRDRRTNESWKFGFAEFATVEDAQAALTKLNAFEKFTIASKTVLASYIHAGVFVPVINPTPSTARFTFSPLNNPAMKLAYWDEEGYVTELLVSKEELDKKPKADSKATKDGDKAKKRKAEASGSAGVKKTAMPSHLQFWSDRHAELHGIQRKDDHDNEESNKASEGRPPSTTSPAAPPSRSYADPNRNCCYLCMRQFKSAAEVNRHERLSQLHRDNLNNEAFITRALAKLEKHRNDPPTAEYRDRAKERRHAFGSSRQTQNKAKPAAAVAVKEDEPTTIPAQSKGAALLSKMGWSAGSGLGAQGTGISAPIATDVYAQGVGLGAQGGKLGDASEEAARNTRGRYDEFLQKTKELARERYERMS
ncbi:hypothetical protein UA08_01858 [Talaromyces atroroseus]|uniref:RNA-binding protein n=1 Tax=Talaromyces atroroseus TaxID=1441469 RepID=A0A1Q5QA40_TALAT|nr:hypothetical protein UA08_01858 [Talaromyces atroroseus]OKL62780.1 hypothetical protein UA08_01858 [Talaromyces atroroseus]